MLPDCWGGRRVLGCLRAVPAACMSPAPLDVGLLEEAAGSDTWVVHVSCKAGYTKIFMYYADTI